MYSGTPLPTTADTCDITDNSECTDCISIDFDIIILLFQTPSTADTMLYAIILKRTLILVPFSLRNHRHRKILKIGGGGGGGGGAEYPVALEGRVKIFTTKPTLCQTKPIIARSIETAIHEFLDTISRME